MNFSRTLAFRLMIFMGGAFASTALAAFLLIDVQVRRIVDQAQREVYREKLDGVSLLLETRVRRLEATGMQEAYQEDFKLTALHTLRDLHYRSRKGGYLFILDRSGAVLLHPDQPGADKSAQGRELLRRMGAGPEGEFDQTVPDGRENWIIYRVFRPWDWVLAYNIPWEEKYADKARLERGLFRVMALISVVVLGLLFGIVTYLSRPIALLTKAATIMSAGNLDYPVEKRGHAGTGEVGLLATAFASLRDSIRERINELKASNEELRREVASRQRAEGDLQESEERLRSTISSLDDLVFVLDREHRFVDFRQPGKLSALYIPPDMFLGRKIDEISFPPEARAIWIHALKELETSPDVQSFDYFLPMPSGETWYSAKASRRIDARGNFAGVTVVARDITDRKRAERELERQNVELRKLDRIKDQLVWNVSHELKTPVAKQAMQLEILYSLLDAGLPRPQVEAVLKVMEASVKRQQQVIRSLLDLARIESGRREVSLVPVDLRGLLSEIIEEFRALTEKAGVAVNLKVDPVVVWGDRELLWHVFSNLISNSFKFRRNEGTPRIDIALKLEEGEATVTVSDNGIGMASTEMEQAFEKFYQAAPSVEGAGVGLTIVREMVQRLGGDVAISSAGPGRGTAVSVSLPVAAGQA